MSNVSTYTRSALIPCLFAPCYKRLHVKRSLGGLRAAQRRIRFSLKAPKNEKPSRAQARRVGYSAAKLAQVARRWLRPSLTTANPVPFGGPAEPALAAISPLPTRLFV